MKLLHKLQKVRKNKKGFTLVEIVVVLVIIAILATLMIGGLNGFIDKAREKAAVVNCRSLVMAAQSIESEKYAEGTTLGNVRVSYGDVNGIWSLAGLKASDGSADIMIVGGEVSSVVYYSADDIQITYNGSDGSIQRTN